MGGILARTLETRGKRDRLAGWEVSARQVLLVKCDVRIIPRWEISGQIDSSRSFQLLHHSAISDPFGYNNRQEWAFASV